LTLKRDVLGFKSQNTYQPSVIQETPLPHSSTIRALPLHILLKTELKQTQIAQGLVIHKPTI